MLLDKQIITSFRNQINSDDWALFQYRKCNDKWSCICSAMDWIDVSVDYLNSHPFSSIQSFQGIELYSRIACVDIIVEAIEQLNRVINSTKKRVFGTDSDCFCDNPFGMNDRDYFKTIRACFGAHPVNLDDPFHPKSKKIRRFASWSCSLPGQGDYSVFLYSNKVNEKYIVLSIHFAQIEKMVTKYYCYLSELQDRLKEQYRSFCDEMRKQKIKLTGGPIQKLLILQRESKKRLNNEYYNEKIKEIISLHRTRITCKKNRKLVREYISFVDRTIDVICNNLQEMNFCDLDIDDTSLYRSLPLPNGWGYWYEKLCNAYSGSGYSEVFWGKEIERIFYGQFVFEYENVQELYVLVKSAIFHLCQKIGNE